MSRAMGNLGTGTEAHMPMRSTSACHREGGRLRLKAEGPPVSMPPVGQGAMGQSFLLRKPEASRALITQEEKDLKDRGRVWKVANERPRAKALTPGQNKIPGRGQQDPETRNPRVCESRLEQAIPGVKGHHPVTQGLQGVSCPMATLQGQ